MNTTKKILKLCMVLILSISASGTFAQEAVKTIQMKVLPGLQFDVVRFHVKPGTKVKIVFKNTDEMDHNLLITKPGAREEVVTAALQMGGDGPAKSYIPGVPQVLWAIPIVSADQTKSITFTAPKEEGVYPYVCTYPGHGFVMYGAMYVSSSGTMPAITKDPNIPPSRRKATAATTSTSHSGHQMTAAPANMHPYPVKAPYLYRVYIDGASPAAIAVNLTDNLSYCWDAGTCKLRFAWKGGFVDNTALWKGHKDAASKILGDVFYRDKVKFPLRIKDESTVPEVDYKGYRLINSFPEFHYTVNGVDVYELIKPISNGNGLVRNFRIPNLNDKVWFNYDTEDGVNYQASIGNAANGKLALNADQAKSFSITMIEKAGASL